MITLRFGEGYVAFLRFNQPIEIKKINNSISNYFSMAKISSKQSTAARFLIPKNKEIKLSETFKKLKQVAEELNADDYTLTQSSLDQVKKKKKKKHTSKQKEKNLLFFN